jgi:hypothetical protein
MDIELQQYREEVIQCLVRYGSMSEEAARHLANASGLLEVSGEVDRYLLFHEYPYYWAMSILYGGVKPEWHLDPTLWPPPTDYHEWSPMLRNADT